MDREEQMGGAPYPIPCTEDTPYHLPSPMILSANVELLEGHDIFDENSNLKRQLRMKDSENKVLKVTINLLEMQLQAQGCSRLNGNSSQAAEHQTEGFGVAGTQVDTAEFMHPDARIFLADNAGMGEIRQGPEIENPLLMSTPNMSFSEAYSGLHAEASVSGGANLTWQRELAPSRSETGESMLTKDTYHVLIQELRFQQTHIKNQGQKLKCAESEIHNMLTQLNYGKKCVQDMTNEIEEQKWENKKLLEKVTHQENEIRELKTQIQAAYDQKSIMKRSSRFVMSKTNLLECRNCQEIFSSLDAAALSTCAHHLKPACELPNKMVAEIFKKNVRHRYWPCCRKISDSIPEPCCHDIHKLRVMS